MEFVSIVWCPKFVRDESTLGEVPSACASRSDTPSIDVFYSWVSMETRVTSSAPIVALDRNHTTLKTFNFPSIVPLASYDVVNSMWTPSYSI